MSGALLTKNDLATVAPFLVADAGHACGQGRWMDSALVCACGKRLFVLVTP